jgi:site-specific recombinase XerD
VLPLRSELLGQLARYIAANRILDIKPLFSIKHARLFQIVQAACLAAGVDRARSHPHVFRHSFAVHCVVKRIPIPIINDWLGHGAIENTLIYCRVVAGDARHFYDELPF